jgi:hypothetical protein
VESLVDNIVNDSQNGHKESLDSHMNKNWAENNTFAVSMGLQGDDPHPAIFHSRYGSCAYRM